MADNKGVPDVMRGEETQIVGAIGNDRPEGVFVMPGTHSKWVDVRDGQIQNFSTFMTGEVFAALMEHTILGTLAEDGPFNEEAFELGLSVAGDKGLIRSLFSVRTLPLMGRISAELVGDYLSGVLIGSEIASAVDGLDLSPTIHIVARDDLAERYEKAIEFNNLTSLRMSGDIVANGHFLIAKEAGIIP